VYVKLPERCQLLVRMIALSAKHHPALVQDQVARLARYLGVEFSKKHGGREKTPLDEDELAAAWRKHFDPRLGRARIADVATEFQGFEQRWFEKLYERTHPGIPWRKYRPAAPNTADWPMDVDGNTAA
jgi:hypothetical protein